MTWTFEHYDAEGARPLVDALVRLQQDIYGDAEPREFFTEERYRHQLDSHMTALGWELVAAHIAEELAGYAYGFPLAEDSRWWRGLLTKVPDGATDETGSRTFALSELMVAEKWRGRGLGRALHDELLADRLEERATLLVEHDNATARDAYLRWGWSKFGDVKPSWDGAPVLEALIRALHVR